MFLTKLHFEESIKALEFTQSNLYGLTNDQQIILGFAQELFPEFDELSLEEQSDVIGMLQSDMKISMFILN